MLDKIEAVENSLLTANAINGHTQPKMNIDDRMNMYHVPGVSIAVINDTKIEWAKGYGVQDVSKDKKVSTETLFQAASVSKPVAAMAALKVVEQGQLNLDGDVNQWLSSWQIPEHEFTSSHEISLRQLLSHTAGLTVHGFAGYAADEAVPTLQQVLDGEPPANSDPVRVDIEPGSQFRYSGGGYTVMQLLLEDVTGTPFAELLQTILLRDLQMSNSLFEQPLPTEYHDRAATAYDGRGTAVAGGWHTYPEKAAAGLWSTPTDLAKFVIEIIQSSQGESETLSSGMVQQMLTMVKDDYGLGFGLKTIDGVHRFSHGGSNKGFRCYMVGYIETGQGAVVMTNSDNGIYMAMEILRSIAHVYDWPDFKPQAKSILKIDPAIYAQFEGEYYLVDWPEFTIQVKQKDTSLLFELVPDILCLELFPETETNYFAAELEMGIEFVRDDDGLVQALLFGPGMRLEKKK